GKTEIHGRKLVVRSYQFNDRGLGFRRKIIAHLGYFRLDLRQGRVGVIVEPQMHRNGAHALRAGRLQVIDAVGAGNYALERRGDEPAHQIGIRADIGGRHPYNRYITPRILADAERADRLQARDQDYQANHNGEHRTLDKNIGELHGFSLTVLRLGSRVVLGLHFVVDLYRSAITKFEDT